MMKGRDFIGVPLMLTERAFRVHERSGKVAPILYQTGITAADLEVGLVFSMDEDDFALACRPERWLADGLVALAAVDTIEAEPVPDVPEPAPTKRKRAAVNESEVTDGPVPW